MKKVFTFETTKFPVSTAVKSAKLALRCWIFLSLTKNRQKFCFVVLVHLLLQKRRVLNRKTKKNHQFGRNFSANHNQTHPDSNKKSRNHSTYGITVSTSHWLAQLTKSSFSFLFYTISVYCNARCFSQSQTTKSSGRSNLDQIQLHGLSEKLS